MIPRQRPARRYGDVLLSVQASYFHYCSPRVTGLPFNRYTSFEIAIIAHPFTPNRRFVTPAQLGIDGFETLYPDLNHDSHFPVAGWVDKPTINRLQAALRRRAKALETTKETP